MPKNSHLFGQYLQSMGKKGAQTFRPYQLTRRIPNKATGGTPSAASQMALWHDDDFNSHYRITSRNQIYNKKIKPQTIKKDFESNELNTTIHNLRVTPSALYAIDDKAGFDNYILRTPPEELRSNAGEKMRKLMYFYQENPHLKSWGLPWKVLLRKRDQKDPAYARLQHELKKAASIKRASQQHSKYSPYYLPKNDAEMHPERQACPAPPVIDRWWQESAALETAFRARLKQAKSFEEGHADHREPNGYVKGRKRGGGGPQGTSMRVSTKTHKARRVRPY